MNIIKKSPLLSKNVINDVSIINDDLIYIVKNVSDIFGCKDKRIKFSQFEIALFGDNKISKILNNDIRFNITSGSEKFNTSIDTIARYCLGYQDNNIIIDIDKNIVLDNGVNRFKPTIKKFKDYILGTSIINSRMIKDTDYISVSTSDKDVRNIINVKDFKNIFTSTTSSNLSNLEILINKNSADIAINTADILSLSGRLNTEIGKIKTLNNRIGVQTSTISSLESDLNIECNKISPLNVRLNNINLLVSPLNVRLNTIVSNISSLNGRLNTVSSGLSSLETRLTFIDGEIVTSNTTLKNINDKVAPLMTRLNSINYTTINSNNPNNAANVIEYNNLKSVNTKCFNNAYNKFHNGTNSLSQLYLDNWDANDLTRIELEVAEARVVKNEQLAYSIDGRIQVPNTIIEISLINNIDSRLTASETSINTETGRYTSQNNIYKEYLGYHNLSKNSPAHSIYLTCKDITDKISNNACKTKIINADSELNGLVTILSNISTLIANAKISDYFGNKPTIFSNERILGENIRSHVLNPKTINLTNNIVEANNTSYPVCMDLTYKDYTIPNQASSLNNINFNLTYNHFHYLARTIPHRYPLSN